MSLPKVIDCFGPTDVQRRSIRLGGQQFWVNVAPVDPKLEYIPVFANHTCVFFSSLSLSQIRFFSISDRAKDVSQWEYFSAAKTILIMSLPQMQTS